MTVPTLDEQYENAPQFFIERDELYEVTLVAEQVLYPLPNPAVANGLDSVVAKMRLLAEAIPASIPGGTNELWMPGADPVPTVVITSPDESVTYLNYTPSTNQAIRDNIPGTVATFTWEVDEEDEALPGQPEESDPVTAAYEAYSDLEGAVLSEDLLAVDISECDMADVVGTKLIIRYRSAVKPLLNK